MKSQLDQLVAPTSAAAFLAEHWGRRPLQSTGVAGRLRSVVNTEELDRLLVSAPDESGGTRGAYCVRTTSDQTHEYPIHGNTTHRRSPAAAREAFSSGYTLVINRLHHTHPGVSGMCARLESELDQPVGCNLYLTPPNSQGFKPHSDAQDTFFLQLEGHKTWQLWEPETRLPLRDESGLQPEPPDRCPDQVVELQADEVLYLPRGWIHAGSTSDRESLHITLGVLPTTWRDLLATWFARQAESSVALREALPLGALRGGDPRSLALAAGKLLREMTQDPALDAGLEQACNALLTARLDRPKTELVNDLASAITDADLRVDHEVVRNLGLQPRVSVSDQGLRLTFPGGFVDGPLAAETAFDFIESSERFRVAAVPDLPDEAKLGLVGGLIGKGFLRRCTP